MSYIRIPLTTELKELLDQLRQRYPILNDVELIKLSLIEAVNNIKNQDERFVDKSLMEFLEAQSTSNLHK